MSTMNTVSNDMGASAEHLAAAAFLKKHCPALRGCAWRKLAPMVEWYARVAGLGVMRVDGVITGVALARCVDGEAEARAAIWAHHEDKSTGRYVWVENMACSHPAGMGGLVRLAAKRFGRREAFIGNHFSRDGRLRMLPWEFLERITKGAMENYGW